MNRIRIRRSPGNPNGLRWGRHPGYRWHCPCCDTGGRVSSWSQVRRGELRTDTFQRVIANVDEHLRQRHQLDHARYIVREAP
ncbi:MULTISPECIES: hypothetical protein [Amycolatopsis]|uniref:Uncharacterized protein n=1 Tax=Amycolatopsis albidoflavus TaxID=102226 RepID=A0ABW5I4A2_9PSEU